MKITEMIAKLEGIKEEHGDLNCYFTGEDYFSSILEWDINVEGEEERLGVYFGI